MANIPASPNLSTGSYATFKAQNLGTSPVVTSSGSQGRAIILGQRWPLTGNVETVTLITGQLFPRGLA